eukprot:CAMPEP_0167752884 /NCGR_PEP_ID=MMETSP0110_2-20121227/7394_1 /TAXON_ID=629695 /ORGANISM="Gymnochlora sp., Strain CCMP2014" /LENGTH=376 /DNA_ID=CAMNT_0007638565 /DNA_START=1401 /DNA_END=2528 /DNA_ORIENTATION=+
MLRNAETYNAELEAYKAGAIWESALSLVQHLLNTQDLNNVQVGTLAASLNKAAQWQSAIETFQNTKELADTFMLTHILGALGKCGRGVEATQVINYAKKEAIRFDSYLYNAAISSVCSSLMWEQGLNLLEKALSDSHVSSVSRGAADLLGTFGRLQESQKAEKVFSNYIQRFPNDIEVYNAMMHSLNLCHRWHNSLSLFKSMAQRGLELNIVSFTNAINPMTRLLGWQASLRIMKFIFQRDYDGKDNRHGNVMIALNAFLSSLSNTGHWKMGLEMYREAQDVGYKVDASALGSCVRLCLRSREWSAALGILEDSMRKGVQLDVRSYNLAAYCYGCGYMWEKAVKLLDPTLMQRRNLFANEFSFSIKTRCLMLGGQW